MKCDHPTSTKDGFIEVSNFRGSYVYGSRATYHCNPGYILWGNSSRLCDSSGQWTGAAPQCRQISCGDPPMIPHSAVALLNGSTQWKSQAVYSCLPGYESPGETLLKVEPLQWTCQTGELHTFNKLLYWGSPHSILQGPELLLSILSIDANVELSRFCEVLGCRIIAFYIIEYF